MLVKAIKPTYNAQKESLQIKYEFTRSDGAWMVISGLIIAFAPAVLGLEWFCPLAAFVWSMMGAGGMWIGLKILTKGDKRLEVISCIKTGRENAVTRAQLVNITGISDRKVRKKIEHYRNSGIPIMSASDGQGYWMASTTEEVERFLREADSRARAQQYVKLRQIVAAAKGEHLVPVRQHYRRLKSYEMEGQVRL